MRRWSGLDIPKTLEDACDPATMALIVYDMQAGVLRQLPDGGAGAVERVSRVLTAARAGGYPVFFTRRTFDWLSTSLLNGMNSSPTTRPPLTLSAPPLPRRRDC